MSDINVNIWTLPAAFMLETDLPSEMVVNLNQYLDELLESEERRSHAGTLVGQQASGFAALRHVGQHKLDGLVLGYGTAESLTHLGESNGSFQG